MSYEIIDRNEYGVLVRKIKSIPTECEKCKFTGRAVTLEPCKSCKTDNSYYLSDLEAAKLESEITVKYFFKVKSTKNKALLKEFEKMINNPDNSLADAYAKKTESEMKVFYDLQIENKQLKERIKEFETEKTTELIPRSGNLTHDYWYYCQECLQDLETDNHNFCPNCGRKIVR